MLDENGATIRCEVCSVPARHPWSMIAVKPDTFAALCGDCNTRLDVADKTVKTFMEINFARSEQQLYCHYRMKWRVCRKLGSCWHCNRNVHQFDDSENDWRGVLGERAAEEYRPAVTGFNAPADVVILQCALCANSGARHETLKHEMQRRFGGREKRQCPACKGRSSHRCPACNGRGTIIV